MVRGSMGVLGGLAMDPPAGHSSRRPSRALPVLAVAVFITFLAMTLAIAGPTLGYDFLAYHAAAARALAGGSSYDLDFSSAGASGLFYYPPTFLPLIVPFGALDPVVATWAWT